MNAVRGGTNVAAGFSLASDLINRDPWCRVIRNRAIALTYWR